MSMTITMAPPIIRRPCKALGCTCPDYNPGARVGMYEQCADCHHTEQVHANPPKAKARAA